MYFTNYEPTSLAPQMDQSIWHDERNHESAQYVLPSDGPEEQR